MIARRRQIAKIPLSGETDLVVAVAPSRTGGIVELRVHRVSLMGNSAWTRTGTSIPLNCVPEVIAALLSVQGDA